MIFNHPHLSHVVNDGYEYTIAGLSTGETVVARFGAKTTFKHNGRRVTRAQAFELVNADAARIERIARETDELVAYGMTEREAANMAAVDTRAKSEALAAARAAAAEEAAVETVEAPAAPARPRPRMSDAQIAESRAAFRQFAALAAESSGVAIAEEAAQLTPAARLAEIHADIDAANKARLDAAFAASDARPDRLSTEGPEFEERRARAFEQFPELAEASLVADLETHVDAAANHAKGERFAVEVVDPINHSGVSAEELVAQTVGPAAIITPRVILAALALRMARNGWSIHRLGAERGGYALAASVQPPYGGPIIATAAVVDGDMISASYGPLGAPAGLSSLPREVFIEATLATSRRA